MQSRGESSIHSNGSANYRSFVGNNTLLWWRKGMIGKCIERKGRKPKHSGVLETKEGWKVDSIKYCKEGLIRIRTGGMQCFC